MTLTVGLGLLISIVNGLRLMGGVLKTWVNIYILHLPTTSGYYYNMHLLPTVMPLAVILSFVRYNVVLVEIHQLIIQILHLIQHHHPIQTASMTLTVGFSSLI